MFPWHGPALANGRRLLARAWLIRLLCTALLVSPLGCTRLKVASSPYSAAAGESTAARSGGVAPSSPQAGPGEGTEVSHPADAAGVSFRAFTRPVDQRQQRLFGGQVLTQLWLQREGVRELVDRQSAASWARLDLVPGDYILEVVEIYEGSSASPPNEDNAISFRLEVGRTAQVDLVVREVPWGTLAVVTLAVVVVVGLVVIAILEQEPPRGDVLRTSRIVQGSSSSFDLPPPPRIPVSPPPRLAPHWVGPGRCCLGVHLMLELLDPVVLWTPGWEGHASAPTGPRVTRFILPTPENQSGRIFVEFDRPMQPFYFDPETLQLWNDDGERIPGGVYYDASLTRAVFHPLRPLAPGSYRFLTFGELLFDDQGQAVGANFEQSFRIGSPIGESLEVPGVPGSLSDFPERLVPTPVPPVPPDMQR